MRAKEINKELEKEQKNSKKLIDALKILSIFRKHISEKFLDESIKEKIIYGGKREIIISEYLVSKDNG